jgi:hypothetical protein
MTKLTDDQLRDACCYLQGRLETAMTLGHLTSRECLVHAIEAIEILQEMRRCLNMEPEGASYDEVANEMGKIYNSEQALRRRFIKLPSCPGIEIKKGHYSGCGGGEDCPTCKGKW